MLIFLNYKLNNRGIKKDNPIDIINPEKDLEILNQQKTGKQTNKKDLTTSFTKNSFDDRFTCK